MSDELKPCPYCGELDEYVIQENTTAPVMNRPSNVISCDITHWCKRDGLPRLSIRVTGRDKADAITAWNTRADTAEIERLEAEVERLREIVNGFVITHDRAISCMNTASSIYMDFSMFTYWTNEAKALKAGGEH